MTRHKSMVKAVSILAAVLTLAGCSAVNRVPGQQQGYNRLMDNGTYDVNNAAAQATTVAPGLAAAHRNSTLTDEIALLQLTSPVKRGETGRLSIKGKPGVRYTATAVYRRAGKTFTTAQNIVSGSDGVASWAWPVSRDTEPGIYRLIVLGGGKMLTTAYTVE